MALPYSPFVTSVPPCCIAAIPTEKKRIKPKGHRAKIKNKRNKTANQKAQKRSAPRFQDIWKIREDRDRVISFLNRLKYSPHYPKVEFSKAEQECPYIPHDVLENACNNLGHDEKLKELLKKYPKLKGHATRSQRQNKK
jgi:hypothetical protein